LKKALKINKIKNTGITQSMSRVGKCIDNSTIKGTFDTLKSEMFYGKILNHMMH
jgi:transposase InsO family protein